MNRRDFMKTAAAGVAAAGMFVAPQVVSALEEDMNRLEDRKHPTKLEQKHVPAIDLPDNIRKGEAFPVKVRVGYAITHPSTPDHWIDEIRLLVDGKEVSRLYYKTGGITAPSAVFMISLDKDSIVEAVGHCNLHGYWISDPVTVKVK